ncbi:MAG: sodium-dependent transporter [Ruminococcaceae bacterium]|nr:sodium-dependent transporter [Oscillospiraceae bacterium]
MSNHTKRDSWTSKWGFILACIGSAVGMGNIWLFPARISAYGGATFLIPYLIFVVIIASTGVIGEMAFGRATRSGPVGAFGQATQQRFGTQKPGRLLGLIPVLGSLALAIGYSVVVGWIFKYLFLSLSGGLKELNGVDAFDSLFGTTAVSNVGWQVLGMLVTVAIMAFGIGKGIEKANKLMIPLFYALFIGLAIYLFTLTGSRDAYRYIFLLDPAGLRDPMVWVYALGQAFFSLSIAGNGTLIYGSYLGKDANIPADAKMVAIFDTCAAVLSALVILPAMAVAGQQLTTGGPGLMFIFLPNVLKSIPVGGILLIIFFLAVIFAGLTSLVNLFEAPTATIQEQFHLSRPVAVSIIGVIGIVVGLIIAPIVSGWMDVCSIYFCPLGALLAAVMFFWVCRKDFVLDQVNLARSKPLGRWFYPMAKYVLCLVTVLVLILGAVNGGIG